MSRKNERSKKNRGTKATGISSKKNLRNRFQVKVLLDANRDDELMMLETIDDLKRKRRWLPTFRNAIRLFFSLCEGRTDVLRELFPAVVESIETNAALSKEVQEMMALLTAAAQNAQAVAPVEVTVKPPKPVRDMNYKNSPLDKTDNQATQLSASINIAENFMSSMGMFG